MQKNAEPALGIEQGPDRPVKKERMNNTMLADFVDGYLPAKTHADLMEQVHLAKQFGADSVEAEPALVRQLTLKSGYPADVGYLWFHDVKVWIPGFAETHGALFSQSIESKLFANSKVAIRPIPEATEGKK